MALGALEILAPRALGRALGFRGGKGLIRAFGAREMAAGIGLLAPSRKGPWLWARVGGDALDLAALGAGYARTRKPGMLTLALVSVAGITALDMYSALRATA